MPSRLVILLPVSVICVLTAAVVCWLFAQPAPRVVAPAPLEVPWVQAGDAAIPADQQGSPETLRAIAANRNLPAEQRVQAICFLARLRDWDGVEMLLDQLDDPSPLIRGRAAASVRQILGTDFLFHAEDEPAVRQAQVEGIRRYWSSRKENPPLAG